MIAERAYQSPNPEKAWSDERNWLSRPSRSCGIARSVQAPRGVVAATHPLAREGFFGDALFDDRVAGDRAGKAGLHAGARLPSGSQLACSVSRAAPKLLRLDRPFSPEPLGLNRARERRLNEAEDSRAPRSLQPLQRSSHRPREAHCLGTVALRPLRSREVETREAIDSGGGWGGGGGGGGSPPVTAGGRPLSSGERDLLDVAALRRVRPASRI